jgi:ABC-type uncharacterized transport system permease subunit
MVAPRDERGVGAAAGRLTGLMVGGVLIAVTSPEVWQAFRVSVLNGIGTAFAVVFQAYAALFAGAFGDPVKMTLALQSGDPLLIRRAFNPILESMVAATPYIFAGLSVALGFRGGLFNIGAEGRFSSGRSPPPSSATRCRAAGHHPSAAGTGGQRWAGRCGALSGMVEGPHRCAQKSSTRS